MKSHRRRCSVNGAQPRGIASWSGLAAIFTRTCLLVQTVQRLAGFEAAAVSRQRLDSPSAWSRPCSRHQVHERLRADRRRCRPGYQAHATLTADAAVHPRRPPRRQPCPSEPCAAVARPPPRPCPRPRCRPASASSLPPARPRMSASRDPRGDNRRAQQVPLVGREQPPSAREEQAHVRLSACCLHPDDGRVWSGFHGTGTLRHARVSTWTWWRGWIPLAKKVDLRHRLLARIHITERGEAMTATTAAGSDLAAIQRPTQRDQVVLVELIKPSKARYPPAGGVLLESGHQGAERRGSSAAPRG